MKKTIIIILIIITICAIGCISIIGLSYQDSQSNSDPTTTSTEAIISESVTTESSPQITDTASDSDSSQTSIVQTTESTENSVVGSVEEITTEFPDSFDLELEILSQYPELPAGCESVSLTMILNYLGYDLDKTHIVDEYLVYSSNFVMGYSGDPYSSSVGGGCYAPGMTITANNFLDANGNLHTAENITGTDFDTLLEYVAQGHPILIWTTINMAYCNKGYYNYDEEGNAYAWDYNEHCVVLAGYDLNASTVTIYDPIAGIVYRDKESFEAIYNDMDQMAIIIK